MSFNRLAQSSELPILRACYFLKVTTNLSSPSQLTTKFLVDTIVIGPSQCQVIYIILNNVTQKSIDVESYFN